MGMTHPTPGAIGVTGMGVMPRMATTSPGMNGAGVRGRATAGGAMLGMLGAGTTAAAGTKGRRTNPGRTNPGRTTPGTTTPGTTTPGTTTPGNWQPSLKPDNTKNSWNQSDSKGWKNTLTRAGTSDLFDYGTPCMPKEI